MTLREYIINYREAHDLSQRQLAILCGLSNGYISMIEADRNPATQKPVKLSINVLKRLADGMGVSLQTLIEMTDDSTVSISAPSLKMSQITADEGELLSLFRSVNDQGKAVILGNARMIAGMDLYRYQYPGSPIE